MPFSSNTKSSSRSSPWTAGAFGNVNANYAIETQTRRLVLQRVGRKKNLDQLRLSSHVANTLYARDFLTPYFHLTDQGDPFIELDGEQFRLMSYVSERRYGMSAPVSLTPCALWRWPRICTKP